MGVHSGVYCHYGLLADRIYPQMASRTLTALATKNAKPQDKPYRLAAGNGLYLQVMPNGSRYWRLKYRVLGKEKVLAIGVYPEVSLEKARSEAQKARDQIRVGGDPSAQKQISKIRDKAAAANTFESVTREWIVKQKHRLAPATFEKLKWLFERHAFPWIGGRPIASIEAPELHEVLQRLEQQNKLETAQRLKQVCGQVFRYAIATSRAKRDVAADLRGAIATPKTTHHASITEPLKIGELLRAIQGFSGSFLTLCALRLAPLVFVRPGELRRAEWSEIDLDEREWRIPAEKMKMGAVHIVPLSTQAVAVLREVKPLTGEGRYVFPSIRDLRKPMSENTVNAALRRLGYAHEEMTGHGFRSMASTLLNEQGWNRDAIERQLAHGERNSIRAAYNYAEYLPERRKMMQEWSNYLDGLRTGAKVVSIKRKAS